MPKIEAEKITYLALKSDERLINAITIHINK